MERPLRNLITARNHGIIDEDQVQRGTPVRAIAPGRRDIGADNERLSFPPHPPSQEAVPCGTDQHDEAAQAVSQVL